MMWILLTIGSALLYSLAAVTEKKVLFKEHALQFLVTLSFTASVIMLLFLPKINFSLSYLEFLMLYTKSILLALASVLIFKTYRHMEISAVEPLKNLSPLFLAIIAYFIIGEKISFLNFIGIFILIIGAYIIQVDHSWTHVIKNLSVFKNRHIDKLIIALVLLSFCAILDKTLIKTVDVFTVMFFTRWMIFINTFLVFSYKYNGYHGVWHSIQRNHFWIVLVVILQLSSSFLFFKAIAIPGVMISLVIPIKRLSTLFTTIIGGEIFHDHGLKTRIIGCVIAILGVILVVI